ncbi:flagellar biosynthesis protein FlhF [Clostridium thermobutyricum]|uniref:Flagellar biosynthesis protein FlhF n=1 Tax=Clostridium thermobutyricum DSM 4928 TaxID=1121339 RepID=A0A1V4SPD9_9CLOT|nr:flagellar biosynthesis protein FlhF [Clostridium thermobutyricum]OPX45336.1 flagellar biosynthesis protein FlhF [Clostridium thermobutyricum DSM 4928]
MVIKKYLVSNMNEALTMIRSELGKNAVIITQRKVRKEGVLGIFKPKLIEVTAAVENSKIVRNTNLDEKKDMENSINSIKKLMEEKLSNKSIDDKKLNNKIDNNKLIENTNETSNEEVVKLRNEISDIKEILNKTLIKTEKIDYLHELLKELDIYEQFYDEFKEKIKNINDKEEVRNSLREIIDKEITIDTEELKGKIVLVGPTGVGKTTTIAKLAGKLALKEGKKVGLITVDTYRIGAVDQLKTYAEIMDIDFKVVLNNKEMVEAVQAMRDLDVILIDSTGRSSKNIMQIKELKNLIGKAEVDSTYLVISGTTKNKDLKNIIEGYKGLEYNKIIITKLDETTSYGNIYNLQKLSGKPIRYLTVGQNVPDDIIDAKKEKVLDLLFLEECI